MGTIQFKSAELIFKKVLLLIFALLIKSASLAQTNPIYAVVPLMQEFGHLTTSRTDFRTTSNGEIWVGDRAYGLLYYNGSNWSNINKLNTPILGSDSINKIFIDKQNNVWITNRIGLIRKNINGYNAYLYGTGSNFPKKNVNDIKVSGSKTFVASNIGLYVLDTITSNWSIFNIANSPLITDTIVSLSVDPTGNIWMAYRGGFAVYNNGTINNFTPTNPKFFNNIIADIAITNYDTLFSVKNIGIFRYSNGSYEGFDDYFWRADSTSFCDPGIYYSSYDSYEYYSSKFAIDSNGKIYFVVNGMNLICYDIDQKLYRREVINYYGAAFGDISPYLDFYRNDSLYYLSTRLNYSSKFVFLIEKFQSNGANYLMMNKMLTSGSVYSDVQIPKSYVGVDQANLVANKINARILNRGDKAWDPISQTPYYNVSSGALNTIFASSIWLGGYDQNNLLYTAGMTYRQIGRFDFWAGPIDTNAQTDSSVSNAFDHIWMTNRSDIEEFRHQFSLGNVQNGTFIVSDYILNWPAFYNYPTYPQKLAPFVDFNMDGLYNPYDGDYPDVKGDQSGWFVFNDVLAPKTETNSPAMGLEIHGMAYGYNCSDYTDSLLGLNFTTFYHYDIYNRSNRDYDSCYFAEWTDFDLGNASDDLVASNLPTNSFCVYNGDPDDDGGDGFGTCAPIQNVTFLKSPKAHLNDGIDNDHNGSIDELDEEIGISSFVHYYNVNNVPAGNPISKDDYYQYMTGSWLDGVPITYGGDGRGNGPGATTTPTTLMFPGNSNSQFASPWNMTLGGIQPTDMRGVGSTGPFNLPAGGKVSFDVALITGPHDSTLNESMVAKIRAQFRNGKFENFKGTIPNIVGPKQVATSTNVVNYSVSLPNTNNTFLWTVTNGIIQSGQGTNSIDVIWGTAGVGSIVLEAFGASNPCRGKDSITINIGLTSNHEIANEITVRIFPNPTKNTLQIETSGQIIDRAIIYNLEGKIVLQQTYVGTINTSNLNSGAYILELLNQQNQSVVRKLFVKE